ncbi:MAG: hypothetical protein JKY56_16255, partial [Kofleriaceae bacterium]|nr:hypothetical protein [Kofleriaceae bacterium]
MLRTKHFSILLSLGLLTVAACGDDKGSSPDARTLAPDSNVTVTDANVTSPDANLNAADANVTTDAGTDAMIVPDAMPVVNGVDVARAAADGVVDLAIAQVFVTYLKPATGNESAGFFVQGVAMGPALFIAVDPASFTTPIAVGDNVSFTITEMDTTGSLRQALSITTEVIHSSSNDLSGLVQDVSAAVDLVTNLGAYESELITAQFTVTQSFSGAGTGFQAGIIETSAVTGSTDLRLRLPITLQDSVGLVTGCTVTAGPIPVWRFNAAAQLSAFEPSEITATCPAPVAVTTVAQSETEVTIEFDRGIDMTSVMANGSQFTFDGGLVASAASVSGRVVTITTGTMGSAQLYTVTIAGTVLDVLGGAVAAPNDTAMFTSIATDEVVCDDGIDDDLDGFIDCYDAGCSGAAACNYLSQLYLWEVDADSAGTNDVEFVEIWNNTNATIDLAAEGYYLVLMNGGDNLSYSAVALSGMIPADGLFVVGSGNVAADQVLVGNDILQQGAD